jgi:two-component system, sporulation sensor kinase B
MFGIRALLLNTLFIMLSVFIYELIAGRRTVITLKVNRILISVLTSASAILCMTFPVALMTGLIYDLRPIPLLISFLYGGTVPGLVTIASIFIYRSFQGGLGFYVSIVTLGIQAVAALLVSKRFHASRLQMKLWIGSGLVIFENILRTVISSIFESKTKNETLFFLTFLIISITTMVLMIWLIEYMKENYHVRTTLARAEKLRVVSELAASIAHEVRNPMTAVRGFTQLLSQDSVIRERFSMELSVMISELDRAHQIISDYLSFARPQEENIQSIDVVKHTASALAVLTPFAHANSIDIKESYQGPLYVLGNPNRFEQALINIVKNAIESMPNSGTVHVVAGMSDNNVKVEIIDTGCGMTENEIARLGTPFYSTKCSGTGLGLTATYQIIHLMNGEIEVKSNQDEGTAFSIVLPSTELPPEKSPVSGHLL